VESLLETTKEPGDKDGNTGDDDMMNGDDVGIMKITRKGMEQLIM
jgi:hypothetical protein